jgi:predicted transposase YbfD/YdcC
MRPRPAWCWPKRGVRTREEQAPTEEARAQAKQEAELRIAPRLLRQVAPLLAGRVVSGDALYCQKVVCRQIVQAGGAYLFAVKANQPDLLEDVALLFRAPPPGEDFATTTTSDKHGGRLERRQLRASAALAGYLQAAGWPSATLVLEVTTQVRWPQHPAKPARTQVRYFLTSLSAATPPAAVLRLVRRHWHIENRLHYVRDVTLGEDACQVRSGRAPQGLAALRNAVVGLLHQHRVPNLAAMLRTNAWTGPAAVLRLLGLTL